MDRLRVGLVVLALAPVAWLIGTLAVSDLEYALPLVLMGLGLGLVAWACPADRLVLAGVGFAAAALGVAWFYDFALFQGLAATAGGIVVIGLALAAVASWAGAPRGAAVGLSVVAVGSLVWVYADGRPWQGFTGIAWEWQVGNVLGVVGGVLSSLYTWWKG